MAPKRSPNYLDYGKTKQVKLPHLRKSSVSQKRTRDHSECSLTVIGGTLRLPNRDIRFGSLADIATSPCHVRFTPESGHEEVVSASFPAPRFALLEKGVRKGLARWP
jgi:hypothetical protein